MGTFQKKYVMHYSFKDSGGLPLLTGISNLIDSLARWVSGRISGECVRNMLFQGYPHHTLIMSIFVTYCKEFWHGSVNCREYLKKIGQSHLIPSCPSLSYIDFLSKANQFFAFLGYVLFRLTFLPYLL